MFTSFIQKKLEKYVQQYFAAHPEIKLVAVSGSVGKTTTRTNIARILSVTYRVRMLEGTRDTKLSTPLDILGIKYPEKPSPFSWLAVFRAAKMRIKEPSDVDVIIHEFGSDRPGEIIQYANYLQPAIGVVTGVTPEHIDNFITIEKIAEEELTTANFSSIALINRDDIDGRFANFLTNAAIDTYGTTSAAEYRFEIDDFNIQTGYTGRVFAPEFASPVKARVNVLGEHSLRPAMAAVATAIKLGMNHNDIVEGLASIRPIPGRMNLLGGMQQSVLIDDTFTSTPASAAVALQTLYALQVPQRVAILGDMNGLGDSAQIEHQRLGSLCDSALLAWVITVGENSEKYLAPYARARGCQVKSFKSALDAGAFAHSVIEKGAAVLINGSADGIYLEEATKILLRETSLDDELVRQSLEWVERKNDFFANLKQ